MKNEKLIADTFNDYFADITKTLKLKKHPNFDGQSLFIVVLIFYFFLIGIHCKTEQPLQGMGLQEKKTQKD